MQPVDHWPLIRPLLTEKIPLFVLAVLSSIVTYLAQHHGGAVGSLEALPLSARMANAFVSYITYMVKMFWPTNLAVFYPHPGSWPLWQVLGSVVLLIAITVLAIRGAKKRPYAAVGWLWYVGTLVPVIGVVQVGGQAMADRYTYIPLVGLFIIVAWAVPELLKKWPYRKEALIALSALCLLCLFLVTWRQVGYWRNSITLYDHALEVADPNSIIYNNRGLAYVDLGNYTQAIADFNRAIEIDPRFGEAYDNRGTAYDSLGDYTQAIADFNRAIEIDPRYGEAYYNRGVAYKASAIPPRRLQILTGLSRSIRGMGRPITTGGWPIAASAITLRRLRILTRPSRSIRGMGRPITTGGWPMAASAITLTRLQILTGPSRSIRGSGRPITTGGRPMAALATASTRLMI